MKHVCFVAKLACIFALIFIVVLTSGTVQAQAISGALTGTVVDPSGAAVVGAKVEAANAATGQKFNAVTKNFGDYRFDELPIGTYNVSISAQGFKTVNLTSVPVELNKTNNANTQLELGSSSTTVEVSDVASPVDTTTAQLQSNYNEVFSRELTITSNGQGAGVLNLSLLSPGVSNSSAMGLGYGPSVGGQRPRDNNFTIEGVDNNNKSVTGALAAVPNDAVDGFTLIANQFTPEFGHSSGGQFNTTVKTGTNEFHGSLYEYFRNRNLDAVDQTYKNQGLTSNPRFDSNRYGATFGGPILKDKLFFFTDFERNPVGLTGASPGAVFAPTAAGLAAIATDPGISSTNFDVFKKYVPLAPAGTSCITYNGTTNSGASRFSDFSAPANGSCAAGSVEVGAVSIAPPAYQNYENFVQSVDYNISSSDQLRGRYIYNEYDLIDTTAQLPAFYAVTKSTFYLVTLSEFHTFQSGILNEFRAGYNRYNNVLPSGNVQFSGLDAFPNITLFDLGTGLNIGPNGNAPSFTIQNLYQFVDNLSIPKGKHSLKVGAEFHWYISPQGFTQRARGDYQYNATQVYLEDFSPDNFGQRSSGSNTYYGNDKAIYWYVNDTWRLTPHLTVNGGLRYEYTTTPKSENLQSLNAISNTPSILVPLAGNQPLIFGKPQAPNTNFAPRVGLVYSPGNSGTTSIRAGFGMAYDTLYDNIGILAVPPQIGATNNVIPLSFTPDFLAHGGLSGGGSGITMLDKPTALANTSNWIPPNQKDPYSINWNLGIQRSFGKGYFAEVGYVGTRGIHLNVQDIIDLATIANSQNALPLYLQKPSQATLDSLTNTLSNLQNLQGANVIPANYANAGFQSPITSFLPIGWSTYNGLQAQLTRRLNHGLTFTAAYTFSRTIDNSTADFHSTDLTPRRPEDFFNLNVDKALSALSRTHRFTIAAVYDLPYFQNRSWAAKNLVGNWQFSSIYTYESPEYVTVQANRDTNLNEDSAGDRAWLNVAGVPGTGSDVKALTNSGGEVVAYLADNPNAQYIRTGVGMLSNLGRNTLPTRPTNNLDFALNKSISFTERMQLRFGVQFQNLFNHAQFIPAGNTSTLGLGVNDVTSFASVGTSYKSYVTPGTTEFNNPSTVFPSNARAIAIVGKFIF